MSRSDVARRYATALVDLCDEKGNHEAVRKGFEGLTAVLAEVPEAAALLGNRTIALARRRELLEIMLGKLGADAIVNNTAKLLLDRGRISDLPAIVARLGEMLDARTGRVTADVVSAVTLDAATLERVRTALGKRLGREVELTASVDPAIMGGLRITVGQLVFDGTVKNHLSRLRERLTASHVG